MYFFCPIEIPVVDKYFNPILLALLQVPCYPVFFMCLTIGPIYLPIDLIFFLVGPIVLPLCFFLVGLIIFSVIFLPTIPLYPHIFKTSFFVHFFQVKFFTVYFSRRKVLYNFCLIYFQINIQTDHEFYYID